MFSIKPFYLAYISIIYGKYILFVNMALLFTFYLEILNFSCIIEVVWAQIKAKTKRKLSVLCARKNYNNFSLIFSQSSPTIIGCNATNSSL